jgi:hypothetical protein
MRTVREIYETYRIMPQLQLHQLRVASVGKLICDAFQGPIDSDDIIVTCLFHDMGNIIKSDFDDFPDSFRGTQPRAYWEVVKEEYIGRYGTDEHSANLAIGRELGLSHEVIRYMDGISFRNFLHVAESDSFEEKIVLYCDGRVAPDGVVALLERQAEARERYRGKKHAETPENEAEYQILLEASKEVERQIFARVSIRP